MQVYVQYMHSICKYMYSICTVCVQYTHSICTVYAQYIYSIRTHKYTLHRLAVHFIVSISKQYARIVPEETDFLCDKPVVCGDTINGTQFAHQNTTPGYCRLRVRREHNVNVSAVQMWYFLCAHLRHLRYVFPVSLPWASYLSWDIRTDVSVCTTELVDRGEGKGWGTLCYFLLAPVIIYTRLSVAMSEDISPSLMF
jgi:hypothetical protein